MRGKGVANLGSSSIICRCRLYAKGRSQARRRRSGHTSDRAAALQAARDLHGAAEQRGGEMSVRAVVLRQKPRRTLSESQSQSSSAGADLGPLDCGAAAGATAAGGVAGGGAAGGGEAGGGEATAAVAEGTSTAVWRAHGNSLA